MFCESDLWKNQQDYFSPGQYLVADSAYPVSTITVPVIKGPASLTQDGADFNRAVANVRACNEHTIGMLKKRFASLRGMPNRIKQSEELKDTTRILDWIGACAILHNFLVEEGELLVPKECEDFRGARPFGDPDLLAAPAVTQAGEAFRKQVMQNVLQVARAEGGIIEYHNTV